MQSSFKKISTGSRESIPVRKIPGRENAAPAPKVQVIDEKRLLISIEKRLATLNQNLIQIYEEQVALGKQAGYEQGYVDGEREIAQLVATAAKQMKDIHDSKLAHAKEYKAQIVQLIVSICNKLLLEQVVKPENTILLVEDALAVLQPPLDALIFCHPERLLELRSAVQRFSEKARGSVEIIVDPLLTHDAIRVESDSSVLEINMVNELMAIAAEMGVELGL